MQATKLLLIATSKLTTLIAADGNGIALMLKAGSAWLFITPTAIRSIVGHVAQSRRNLAHRMLAAHACDVSSVQSRGNGRSFDQYGRG